MSVLQQLIEWDKSVFLTLNNVHTPFWDIFMWIYTDKLTWIPLILSLLFVLFRKNWKEALLVCVAIALTITLCDQFASTLCKPYFARFRPAQDPDFSPFVQIVNGYRGGRYGFISSHAANSFGAVVLLSLIFRNRLFNSLGYYKLLFPHLFGSTLSGRYFVRYDCRHNHCIHNLYDVEEVPEPAAEKKDIDR